MAFVYEKIPEKFLKSFDFSVLKRFYAETPIRVDSVGHRGLT